MQLPPAVGDAREQEKLFEQLADQLEKSWQAAQASDAPPDLSKLLPPRGDTLRTAALEALIRKDLAIRWQRGRGILLERYLEQFPELGDGRNLSPELIFDEYRARQRFGDPPDLATYQSRFPNQFPELERMQTASTSARGATLIPPSTPLQATPAQGSAMPGISSAGASLAVGSDYKLLNRIGIGSFGEVWRAEAPGAVEVAIKIIHRPLDHEEAQAELHALELIRGLRHPYLLQTHAFWTLQDRLLIVMDLADSSLRDYVKQCKKAGLPGIPLPELLGYFREAAEALDFLHEKKVIHRDVKPANILLVEKHVKLADFGLARVLQTMGVAAATGCGTPSYMAPEMWDGQISPHSDQYGLAITYAELRMNRSPFDSRHMVELMHAHRSQRPNLTLLPEDEQRVIHKALAKKPSERYASCQEFMHELEAALPEEIVQASRPSVRKSSQRLRKPTPFEAPAPRRRWLWPAALVLLLACSVLAYFGKAWLSPRPAPAPFVLVSPAGVVVGSGETRSFSLEVRRDGFAEPLSVTFANLPPDVTIAPATIDGDADQVQLEVSAAPEAVPGNSRVTIRAETGAQRHETVLDLSVLYLPPNFERVGDETATDQTNTTYYKRIARKIKGDMPVVFVLVPKKKRASPPGRTEPDTFYIMENKVWVGLFRRWDGGQRDWEDPPSSKNAKIPALGMLVADAQSFASEYLKGNLPTIDQWDAAAGFFEHPRRGAGPYKGTWGAEPKPDIAVGREELDPRPVGDAKDDESPLGCRDMAGNGEEWTFNLLEGWTVPKPNPDPGAFNWVRLRGRAYNAPAPLQYSELENSTGPKSGVLLIGQTRDDVGFRVVLKP